MSDPTTSISLPQPAQPSQDTPAPAPDAIRILEPLISEAVDSALKPGWQTTEFWLVAVVILAALSQAATGKLTAAQADGLASLLALSWTALRASLKVRASSIQPSAFSLQPSPPNGAPGDPATAPLLAHETLGKSET